MRAGLLVVALIACLALAGGAHAHEAPRPLNDLFLPGLSGPLALEQGLGQTPEKLPVQKPPAPPLRPTPRAHCGPGSRPEPGIQGRVPAGAAAEGLWCNLSLVAHQGSTGGFRVWRYVDTKGRECAFYDTALLFPLNAFNPAGPSLGVAVLDMTDPSRPVQTATLTDLAMLSPHESLNLNSRRGLLAAVAGNPGTYPGWFSVYDVSADCRTPVLQAAGPYARFGHESGFSPDGNTFYAAATAIQQVTALDLTDPKNPQSVWVGNILTHGLSLTDDGNRAFLTDPIDRGMVILDTTEIQARKPNPQAHEVSRITWDRVSIPQNAMPFTSNGKPYVLEFDEYEASTLNPSGSDHDVGAGRIIDIGDERNPRIVSHLRLEVNEPEQHAAAADDPGGGGSPQGYAAHYCNLDSRVNPRLVACSFIASGLRVFDITDVERPREVGYFVPPAASTFETQGEPSAYAMSQPQFVPERREVWFTNGVSGFYVLRMADAAWPAPRAGDPAARCRLRRPFRVSVRLPRAATGRRVRVTFAGRRVRNASRRGRTLRATLDPARVKGDTGKLVVRARTRAGRAVTVRRTFRFCPR